MMTRDQLSCLSYGDSLYALLDVDLIVEGVIVRVEHRRADGGRDLRVRWQYQFVDQFGTIDAERDNPRLFADRHHADAALVARMQRRETPATMARVPQPSRLADAWTAYVVVPATIAWAKLREVFGR